MAKLYEINQESAPGEITNSLAQSLKKGIFAPTEKKLNALETEIGTLTQIIELETRKLALETNEKFTHLEKEYEQLKKMFHLSISLSIISLVSIITTLIFLYNRYN